MRRLKYQFQLIGDTIPEEDEEIDTLWEFVDSLFDLIDPSIDGPLKRFPCLKNLPGKYGRAYRRTIVARDRVAKRYFEDIKVRVQFLNFVKVKMHKKKIEMK